MPTKYLDVSVDSVSNRTTDNFFFFFLPRFAFFWWVVALLQTHRAQHLHLATPAGDKGLILSASTFKLVLTFSYIYNNYSSTADWLKLLLLKTSIFYIITDRKSVSSVEDCQEAHGSKHMTWFLMPSSSSSIVVLSWKTRNWNILPFVPTAWTVIGRSKISCGWVCAQQRETKHRKNSSYFC